MNNRIKEIITSKHLSDGEFADIVGIKRSTLSHCLSGRNDVSKDIITKIHNAYPCISINWLMFGEGDSGLNVENDQQVGIFNSEPYLPQIPHNVSEYDKENSSNYYDKAYQYIEKEDNSFKNKPISEPSKLDENIFSKREIEKIILFYTDGTFETFEK